MGLHVSHGTPEHVPGRPHNFRLRGCHSLWRPFPGSSPNRWLDNFPTIRQNRQNTSDDPKSATTAALARIWFRLFPVRSPLLRESQLMSSPAGTEMFHFPAFPTYSEQNTLQHLD